MSKVAIVGVGRVGGGLAVSLPSDKYTVANLVYHQNPPAYSFALNALRTPFSDLSELTADVVFITTQDSCIRAAAEGLVTKLKGRSTIFHSSGALDSTILQALSSAGHSVGSIHPLVSISDPALAPERFRGAYFCVEGDREAVELGSTIVTHLGGKPFSIDTTFKTLYHAAAVTACGHLVALFDGAVEMMQECGLSADQSKEVLMPLVTSTVQNLASQSTASALTGTFARADVETFSRHLTALNAHVSDDLLELYLLLGERSLELAAKAGANPDRIETMRSKVAIAKSKLKW